jgi:hypothetical protein
MSFVSVHPRTQRSRGFQKMLIVGCIAVAALLGRAPAASATPILSFSNPSSTVFVGDLVTIDFVIDDFTDLFSFQFGVRYDAALLSLVGVFEGSHLATAGGTSFFAGDPSTPGVITFIANALSGFGPGANGGGTLFSVQFNALAAGTAFAVPLIDPSLGDGLYDSSCFDVSCAVIPTGTASKGFSILPRATVPEPATLVSFAIGAAVWGAARRRQRRRASASPITA